MPIIVRPAKRDDLLHLAPRLREEDVREVEANSGKSPLEALELGLEISEQCMVACDDTGPVAVFGVCPVASNPDFGSIWMLGTEAAIQYPKSMLRLAKEFFEAWHGKYPVLGNWVDARNVVHISWLKRLGCQFVRKVPFGSQGLPFFEFIHV